MIDIKIGDLVLSQNHDLKTGKLVSSSVARITNLDPLFIAAISNEGNIVSQNLNTKTLPVFRLIGIAPDQLAESVIKINQ